METKKTFNKLLKVNYLKGVKKAHKNQKQMRKIRRKKRAV